MKTRIPLSLLALLAAALAFPRSTEAAKDSGSRLLADQIRHLLETQCLACHGGKFKQAGLNLSTRELLLQGSDNGAVIVPGNAQASLLVKKVKHEHEPGMPYRGKKLPEAIINQIVQWINAGAPYDRPLQMSASDSQLASLLQDSGHWAFQRPRRVVVPKVKNAAWVHNPIDAFVAAEHEKRGLKPLLPAGKRTLLRRVCLDLIGLPPTPKEMRAFLADRSADAYEKVVDQLLASPRYGERWGRHWMDIWRYSDRVYGQPDIVDFSYPHIWRWRDWIIDSVNQDKPYHQMIIEMLAGDEIAPTDPQTVRATGYLVRSWYRYNRNVWLQDVVEHTAAGLLGITLRCARCHDHKYDPIAQEEYYRFRAFFEPFDVRIDPVPGQPDTDRDGLPRAYDSQPKEATKEAPYLPAIFAETYRFVHGDEKNPDKAHPLAPGIPEALGSQGVDVKAVVLPLEASYPDIQSFVHQDLLTQAQAEVQKAQARLDRANTTFAHAKERVASMSAQQHEHSVIVGTSSHDAGPSPGLRERQRSRPLSPATAVPRPASPPGREGQVSFEKEIQPILEKNCFSCHSAKKGESGLVLESTESILQGGKLNGPAAIPRKGIESPLIQYLRGDRKPLMPLGGHPLLQEEIVLVEKWIDQLPEDDPQTALQKAKSAVSVAERELAWARANVPAMEARIAADKAKYARPTNSKAAALAQTARELERQTHLLKSEIHLLRAQQKLSDALQEPVSTGENAEKVRENKVAAARKELQAAQASLSQATESYTPLGKTYPESSTGRRTALARWIASKENPLTARVAVNHMWLRHFGRALVSTVSNFGLNGRLPSHPELLDWLAMELMQSGWSMKTMHRLMVTSSTYQMQSSAGTLDHSNLGIDAENRYWWRMNARRMEAEVVRDSLLHVTGQLDVTTGGPDLDADHALQSRRRSLYFRHSADSQPMFLKIFDAANPEECYERNESVIPQQALAMANSSLSYNQARSLAGRIYSQAEATSAFIEAAFETVLARLPSPMELTESERFLAQQVALFQRSGQPNESRTGDPQAIPPARNLQLRARENLVHALLNHNDFVTIR